MKIVIKADKVRLRLWLPLAILKSRFGYRFVKQFAEQSNPSISREQVLEMYRVLKQSIKRNGHFNLVEVQSHDGERVLIRV